MGFSKEKRTQIKEKMLTLIFENKNPFIETLKIFNISRQTLSKYLKELEKENLITSQGGMTRKIYKLNNFIDKTFTFKIKKGISEEDIIYNNSIKPFIANQKENIKDIILYSFTEMVNNVIDHSESSQVIINIFENYFKIHIIILDFGIGIFKKIVRDHQLSSEDEAIFQLHKGKLTSDSTHHSGEGIFFTSRACDIFVIFSGDKFFSTYNTKDMITDYKNISDKTGTNVHLVINKNTTKNIGDIFNSYTDDDYGFSKTEIRINLAEKFEKTLISRSQAKRVLAELVNFTDIVLDFADIRTVGQGFLDEIFRVFTTKNPDKKIKYINTNEQVNIMLAHVLRSTTK
ncbi:MAG: STAS-like domain-containing protein [Fusobacteriaceae bacterium]